MTAQEFLENKFNYNYSSRKIFTYDELVSFGIEFAKMHVQLALSQAAEKAKTLDIWDGTEGPSDVIVNKELILNSYNLENIK